MVFSKLTLKQADFARLSEFIYQGYGIVLPPSKKTMLEGRLQKSVRAHNFESFQQYLEYVLSPGGREEIVHMVDKISTNKTDFFREPLHFDFLQNNILPEFAQNRSSTLPLTVWSAASSSGEEVYSICMTLEDGKSCYPNFDYTVYGTDISLEQLRHGKAAVYSYEKVKPVPLGMKHKYLLKSKDWKKPMVRVVPSLRSKVRFERMNLMNKSYGVEKRYDVIFCRNVLIYFDRKTQEQVLQKLCQTLRTGGYLLLGHSESAMGLKLPLKQVKPTIYQKTEA